LLFFRQVS